MYRYALIAGISLGTVSRYINGKSVKEKNCKDIEALLDSGINVPKDISVVGFDNLEILSVIRPKISVIAQPLDKIGEKAAEIIIKRINGDKEGYPSISRLATELILRGSIGDKK